MPVSDDLECGTQALQEFQILRTGDQGEPVILIQPRERVMRLRIYVPMPK